MNQQQADKLVANKPAKLISASEKCRSTHMRAWWCLPPNVPGTILVCRNADKIYACSPDNQADPLK
jgi:hypothetical protein